MKKSITTPKNLKWNESKIQPLIELYESGKALREVGEIYSLSRERVRQLFESVGYQRRVQTNSPLSKVREKRKLFTKEELERLYLKEKFTLKKMAKLLGASPETVRENLVRCGIRLRTKWESDLIFRVKCPELTGEKLYQLYIVENKSQTEIGRMFGYSSANIAKLAAKYGILKFSDEVYKKRYGRARKQPISES